MLLTVCDSGMRQSGLAQLMDFLDGLVLIHIHSSIRYYYCVWPPLEKMKADILNAVTPNNELITEKCTVH